jgi:hypothetical protein
MTQDPRPDQIAVPPTAVVAPGGAAGVFKGRLVVVFGPGYSGVFVYNPTPANGNLKASIAAQPGTDPYGNAYPAGIMTTNGTIEALLNSNALQWDNPGDPVHQALPSVFGNPSGTLGNSLSITSGIGTSAPGTASGLTFYDNVASSSTNIPSGQAGIAVSLGAGLIMDGWHSMPAMSAGWTAGGFAKYRLSATGDLQVAFQNLTPSSVADGTTIWAASSLPSAYQPAHTERIVCYTDIQRLNGANTEGAALLFGTDGSVQCFGIAAAATRVDLFHTMPITV